ncbi:MAG: NfeD family protein [Ostreibacterium sp.]
MSFLIDPFFYNWLILAAILFIFEVASFTLFFLWLAIAALIMAGISALFPTMQLTYQLWLFASLSVISVVVFHRLFRKSQKTLGDNKINNRAARYIGRTATLVEAIENGRGKIRIEDSVWRVTCTTDLPIGNNVEVIGTSGVILTVIPK